MIWDRSFESGRPNDPALRELIMDCGFIVFAIMLAMFLVALK